MGCFLRLPIKLSAVLSIFCTTAILVRAQHEGPDQNARLVKDINNAVDFAAWSSPSRLVDVGGIGFFTADDGGNGRELWRTDGSAAGTMLVKDIFPGAGGSFPIPLGRVGGTLFLSAIHPTTGRGYGKAMEAPTARCSSAI
jgi:ELWxxDGT repeat protein